MLGGGDNALITDSTKLALMTAQELQESNWKNKVSFKAIW